MFDCDTLSDATLRRPEDEPFRNDDDSGAGELGQDSVSRRDRLARRMSSEPQGGGGAELRPGSRAPPIVLRARRSARTVSSAARRERSGFGVHLRPTPSTRFATSIDRRHERENANAVVRERIETLHPLHLLWIPRRCLSKRSPLTVRSRKRIRNGICGVLTATCLSSRVAVRGVGQRILIPLRISSGPAPLAWPTDPNSSPR
jgi:hypothetical protein